MPRPLRSSRFTALQTPPWTLALGGMLSVQLGSALSIDMIETVGPTGTAWLRLSAGALILLLFTRPPLRSVGLRGLLPVLSLGVITGVMSVVFLGAIERIPLGTTVAVEFLGPLTVAALRTHSRNALAWPLLALGGVLLLTEPWRGEVDVIGLGLALLAAVCWGAYILLTQHVGDQFEGLSGLSITIPVAALTTAIPGIASVRGHLTPSLLISAIGLAILFPVLPYALELMALRRMTPAAFGTLMAVEPAIGTVLGLLILHQQPTVGQLVGITLVVVAGIASQRTGSRRTGPAASGDAATAKVTDAEPVRPLPD